MAPKEQPRLLKVNHCCLKLSVINPFVKAAELEFSIHNNQFRQRLKAWKNFLQLSFL